MADLRERTADLIADRPEIEPDLRELLAVDERAETWAFDDVPLDSGDFGEVVSRGIVEKRDGAYRVADREAVSAALSAVSGEEDGEPGSPAGGVADDAGSGGSGTAETGASGTLPSVAALVRSVDRRTALALAGTLALLVVVRSISFGRVFRDGNVVLYPNDPYFYRYAADLTTEAAAGPFDVGAFTSFQGAFANGEPLFVATTSWVAELLGGGPGASGLVLAWYPVLAAVATGLGVYALARRVTGDRRVAVAAVALLAVTPMHAFRTGLGFGDHHAFDYVWLAVTALGVVAAVGADREGSGRRPWAAIAAIGVGAGAQTLAWESGPLLTAPAVAVVGFLAVSAARADRSPLSASLPVVGGLGLGGVVVAVVHFLVGWHTDAVTAATLGLAGVAFGLAVVAEAGYRQGASARTIAGAGVAAGLLGGVVALVVLPDVTASALDRFGLLVSEVPIAETSSLVSGPLGFVVGPLYNFGVVFLLGGAYLVWATLRTYRSHRPRWIALVTYAWFFLALSLVQVRFAGQLGLFLTPFAGLGFVHAAAWVDVARVPGPFRDGGTDGGQLPDARHRDAREGEDRMSFEWPGTRPVAYFVVFWLVLATPGLAVSAGYVNNTTIDDDRYAAAVEMREYAADAGLTYPRSYVLSRWGFNRMYNYFVNGRARSYTFAREKYPSSLRITDTDAWYDRSDQRIGFVVVDREQRSVGDGLIERLLAGPASDASGSVKLDHFRLLYRSEDLFAYRVVPGATVTGEASSETVVLSTTVEVSGEEFTYQRTVTPGDDGRFSVRVPYPGEYTVGQRSVTVPETAVENGTEVAVAPLVFP